VEGRIKKNDGRGEFKYDVFDVLYGPLKMPQGTSTQHNEINLKKKKKKNLK
jgi:hypothetical protein